MQSVSSFVLVAGLAVAAPVFAQTTASPRGTMFPPGSIVTMRDELENFPVDTSLVQPGVSAPPTTFTGPAGFVWPDGNIRGQSITFTRIVDLAGAPVTGANGVTNASKVLRIRTPVAQTAGLFFFGASYRFGGNGVGEPTQPIEPIPGVNARVSAEHWVSGFQTMYSFEPASAYTPSIVGRTLWGGRCDNAVPVACQTVLDYFLVFAPNASFENWAPARYCEDANGNPIAGCVPPTGFNIGDIASPPIQNWFRLAAETTADGRFRLLVDHLDGSDEAVIHENVALGSVLFDRLGWNSTFEAQDEFLLIDNIEASGALWQPPAPPSLNCPYLDDIEWLNPGAVVGQTQRWFAALSSAATVIDDGVGNRFLRQINNVSPSNEFRQELNTAFPNSYAMPADPWSVCLDAATTTANGGNVTARAFAIDSEANNFVFGGVTARVYLGITDPVTGIADSFIYVQINPEYNPIDEENTLTPLDNAPVIGVDVVSTGVEWPADGQFRTLCIAVANDNAMTVSLEGVEIYSGVAFSNGASLLRVESENTTTGEGARLDLDNIDFQCDALPVVSLAALKAPYFDDFEWGVDNVPPQRHIDDPSDSPLVSARFTNASGVVMLDGAVAMRNVFTDTTHSSPPNPNGSNPILSPQFTTRTPPIVVDTQTGWRVGMALTLSDFLTSRGFAPAQLADVGGAFEIGGYLWISAVDQRVYLFGAQQSAGPDDNLVVIDTGFTLDALGVTPNTAFTARAEFDRDTGMIDWSMNGVALGSTNPVVGTDDKGAPRVHRNLDAVILLGGDDDTAPQTAPYSTMTLDDLRVTRVVPCADANGDNIVNFTDLNAVLASFGQTGAPGTLPADFNGDGIVNFADLNAVLAAFGTSCG